MQDRFVQDVDDDVAIMMQMWSRCLCAISLLTGERIVIPHLWIDPAVVADRLKYQESVAFCLLVFDICGVPSAWRIFKRGVQAI